MGRKKANTIGKKFNKLTVIDEDIDRPTNVIVQCECGTIKSLDRFNVKNGRYLSCNRGGCNNRFIWVLGQKFGTLTVIEQFGTANDLDRKREQVKVKCDCGIEFFTIKNDLLRKHTTSCGSGICNGKIIDISNQKFGSLLVIKLVGRKDTNTTWECLCDCGKKIIARSYDLRNGSTKSCGCLRALRASQTFSLPLGDAVKNRIFASYKRGALTRNLEFNLSFDLFIDLIFGNCHYCGVSPNTRQEIKNIIYEENYIFVNGIDRQDNNIGYTQDNCVSCCTDCNFAKRDMSLERFITLINRFKLHNV